MEILHPFANTARERKGWTLLLQEVFKASSLPEKNKFCLPKAKVSIPKRQSNWPCRYAAVPTPDAISAEGSSQQGGVRSVW